MAKEGTRKTPDYDPENPRQDDLPFLLECLEKGEAGIKEWNRFCKDKNGSEIWLQDAYLYEKNLRGITLFNAHLEGVGFIRADLENGKLLSTHLQESKFEEVSMKNANFHFARLQRAWFNSVEFLNSNFCGTYLESAEFFKSNLQNANFEGARLFKANLSGISLQGADFSQALIDGETIIWDCKVNKWEKGKRYTNFAGVGLGACRIQPGVKQLLEYNIRRSNWDKWYKEHKVLQWFVKPFWLTNDYGFSTTRIIGSFALFSVVFALVYWLCPACVEGLRNGRGFLDFIHALYFSVVTMTTLGFGDIHANSDSWMGQILLMLQVLLGYGLLGSLITRLAILFTADGPAGKFVPMDKDTKELLKSTKGKV